LVKFRKAQGELEDAEDRAKSLESTLSKLRSRNRSSVSTGRSTSTGRTIKSVSVSRISSSR